MTAAVETAFDTRAFRHALGQFPTGVCIVTTKVDGRPLGMTISSFNSLSLAPPLILFSIDRKAASLPLWERAEACDVNVLAENQKELSNRFAHSLANKWEATGYSDGYMGVPLLPGVIAAFECAAHARHDGGDHMLFIAEVKRFRAHGDRQPLVFGKGRYAALQPTELAAPLWPLDIHY
ncbi:MAG: flavin reductase family protein [Pseudomonadota bacterium]